MTMRRVAGLSVVARALALSVARALALGVAGALALGAAAALAADAGVAAPTSFEGSVMAMLDLLRDRGQIAWQSLLGAGDDGRRLQAMWLGALDSAAMLRAAARGVRSPRPRWRPSTPEASRSRRRPATPSWRSPAGACSSRPPA